MENYFGTLPSGQCTKLYTIARNRLTARISDYGATLVQLLVPDRNGVLADVVLGYDDCNGYRLGDACLGATVGRNANRTKDSRFTLNGVAYTMAANEGSNNLHSGPDYFFKRLWTVTSHSSSAITLELLSPHLDQGFPGNALIQVTYSLEADNTLRICYHGICDRDTVFNMTNHSYFNLAGHDNTEAAAKQMLTLPGRFFHPDDAQNIPTGESRSVAGTPMDFRSTKPVCQDLFAAYEPLKLQGGYDHNWEAFCDPCAILTDPDSGRTLAISTDCPGIQFYSANFLEETGKGGTHYGKYAGVALETQYYPNCLNHPHWPQPIVKAGEVYHSETRYRFTW